MVASENSRGNFHIGASLGVCTLSPSSRKPDEIFQENSSEGVSYLECYVRVYGILGRPQEEGEVEVEVQCFRDRRNEAMLFEGIETSGFVLGGGGCPRSFEAGW